MIKGIGVDLVSLERMERAVGSNDHFVRRVFSPDERALCSGAPRPVEKYAGRYAAKEAFLKVCGRGVFSCPFHEIEVLNRPQGEPYYRLGEQAQDLLSARGIRRVHLSISHDGGLAIAYAVGEE